MNLWSVARRSDELKSVDHDGDTKGWRPEAQHDHDRLLFSTPVRRLSDKTQVWPMDANDGVRTRLTHSHEVANLARSIGSNVAQRVPALQKHLHDSVQPILSAIGLAHDLGNPPFGHQGETAIGKWFNQRKEWIFSRHAEKGDDLVQAVDPRLHEEFLKFDGNPQTFRLITRLQTHRDYLGLDLTAACLAASLKYVVAAGSTNATDPVFKKYGYFEAELDVVNWVREKVGVAEGKRHPLTWIMEACDDIAYSTLDVDDVMKKKIISPDDVLTILTHDDRTKEHEAVKRAAEKCRGLYDPDRDPHVARDIKINMIRAYLIRALIDAASDNVVENASAIMDGSHMKPLMEGNALCDALKDIAKLHAFSNPAVLKMEALGAEALDGLMSFFWRAITNRKEFDEMNSKRTTASAKYGWSLISSNYIEAAIRAGRDSGQAAGTRYRELRLLTDMVSGMTDTFALNLWSEVRLLPE
ncbi:dGTP triphosphohydrolase [Agrobacterium tumefaciens]|uniref:dGTPase n=1 Tax=Agrobacterium tumefaciens TaxID=358 RepID=A0A2L2LHA1_AGRTU|nr:dNTP triphosphohydrolase [Agrobacterium tumefaciens]AVH43720.1 dGTPase [Agrobacterium tumefaciens]NSY97660.1 dNTP triphosphohydrolase [Agrobacterium tumefaciens]